MSESTLLVATTNAGKLREIKEMLAGLSVAVLTLDHWPDLETPEETGSTFSDNARLKAYHYAAKTGLPTVAEDSGLEIDALDGEPGIASARFGGEQTSYAEKFALIYSRLARVPSQPRTARFVCALALVADGHVRFEASGVVEGLIAPEPLGTAGFGYDPIFYYPPFGCTLAEAGARKQAVSHRAIAFKKLRAHLLTGVR